LIPEKMMIVVTGGDGPIKGDIVGGRQEYTAVAV
jgi:hypothetical protein